MQTGEELVKQMPEALIRWYDFKEGGSILFILDGIEECNCLINALPQCDTISIKSFDSECINKKYDYIVAAGVIEKCKDIRRILNKLLKHLSDTGVLLLIAYNRMAIKNFCGNKDPYTNRLFDGILDYNGMSNAIIENAGGRCYSKSELVQAVHDAGFANVAVSGIYPDILRPQMLIGEGYTPNEKLEHRIFPQYNHPETVFLQEERIYDALANENALVSFANGFFIECTVNGNIMGIKQVTLSSDRGRDTSLATILLKDKVVKRALFEEGNKRVNIMREHYEYLLNHNVPLVPIQNISSSVESDNYLLEMPYIKAETAVISFRRMIKENPSGYISALEKLYDIILSSSEHVSYDEIDWSHFKPGWQKRKADDPAIEKWKALANGTKEDKEKIGVILERGYIELFAINCFYKDDNYLFFDQEEYIVNCPAKAILLRSIDITYQNHYELELVLPKKTVMEHFGLDELQEEWRHFAWSFLEPLRKERELDDYHQKVRVDYRVLNENRARMNYSAEQYRRYFNDIFSNLGNKKVYLFGSGRFTERFLKEYGSKLKIAGIIDNNEKRWGDYLNSSIPIYSPSVLNEEKSSYKVYICIKDYESVLNQLIGMGVKNISIFDPSLQYDFPDATPSLSSCSSEEEQNKPYDVGYVAGAFDMFHVGHLNILRRAKEQCNYLIVGVITDEQIRRNKGTNPVIGFEDRKAIVGACKYVDKVVEIPASDPSTENAWRTYHFDAQFSGSDYENDPHWLSKKTFLRQHGSDLVFFPYTESVSTTKLKEELGRI